MRRLMGTAVFASLALWLAPAPAAENYSGKYFCFVTNMTGIQQDQYGSVFAGKLQPAEEKFFIDVHLAVHPFRICATNKPELTFDNWFLCLATYEIEIGKNKYHLRSDIALTFYGSSVIPSVFYLSKDGDFIYFNTDISDSYVSNGKCSKI
jgi:hypothetical protein